MTTPAPEPAPKGDERNLVPVDETYIAPSLEDQLRAFWDKHRGKILLVIALAFLAIVGRSAWEMLAERRERALGADYARAASSGKLRTFAKENAGTTLAGAAYLALADEASAAGKHVDAAQDYAQAIEPLKGTALADRARLGQAAATLNSGDAAKGQELLRKLADDASALVPFRTEAAYHLAAHAAGEKNFEEARRFCEQVGQIDSNPFNPWRSRADALRSTLPEPAATLDFKPAAP